MFFSVFTILASIFVVDSAPKLGDLLYDPLEFEAAKNIRPGDVSSDDDFLENQPSTKITKESSPPSIINQMNIQNEKNRIIPLLRLPNAKLIPTNKPVRRQTQENYPKFGYEFDPSKCIVLHGDERVICGYDKNKGEIPQEHPINPYPANNECRLRAGRIECGYVQGGYILARKALRVTPDLYSVIPFTSYPMSRITFPKVSPQLVSSVRTKTTSKPFLILKLITNNITPTTKRIQIKAANSSASELALGKMTTTLLTSRSGILSSKITAENKHHETLTDPSTILRDAPLPKIKELTTKLLQDKAIGRTGE